ncbi:TPA: DnaD domain protein, partial [Staphylococcus aureus]|nr:DnaD domain protein [Staphylococcus aureus]
MNKLLIDDYPIQVLPKLAELIGLNEAIVLQQIHYWLNNSKHKYDGKTWIFNSYPEWQKQFPFWSERTIKRTFGSLEKQNLLHVGNYNKAGFDRTKWYSINYETLNKLVARPSGQNGPTMRTNW